MFSSFPGGDSGELTPVSISSEFEYHHQQSDADTSSSTRARPPECHVEECSDEEQSPLPENGKTKKQFNVRTMNDFEILNAELMKKRFDTSLSHLDIEEEDEEDKTITTMSVAPRESIVGFFSESQSEDGSKSDELKQSQENSPKPGMRKSKSQLSFNLESEL